MSQPIDLTIKVATCCTTCKHFQGKTTSHGTSLNGWCGHPGRGEKGAKTTRMSICDGYEFKQTSAASRVIKMNCEHNFQFTLDYRSDDRKAKWGQPYKNPALHFRFEWRCTKCKLKAWDGCKDLQTGEELKGESYSVHQYLRKKDYMGYVNHTTEPNPWFEKVEARWKEFKKGQPWPEGLEKLPDWTYYGYLEINREVLY